jgi:hypothetical protein
MRGINLGTKLQFKFRLQDVSQMMTTKDIKRTQLFLSSSIFSKYMKKNFIKLAQAAGSNDSSTFVRSVNAEDELYATGPLYPGDDTVPASIDFDIERDYCEDIFFRPSLEQKFNDCVVYTINTVLGFPYFRFKEQVIRLMVRQHYRTTINAAKCKREQGVRMSIFCEPFAVTKLAEDRWVDYRVKKILEVNFGKPPSNKWEQEKLTRLDTFLTQGKIDAGFTTGRYVMLVMFRDFMKHAYAITVDKEGTVAMYDSGDTSVVYTNKADCELYDLNEIYLMGQVVILYKLVRRECNKPTEHLTFIKGMMTGEEWSAARHHEEERLKKFKKELDLLAYGQCLESDEERKKPNESRYSRRTNALEFRKHGTRGNRTKRSESKDKEPDDEEV